MLNELSKIAVGMLGLQGFPLQPISMPAGRPGTSERQLAEVARESVGDPEHGADATPADEHPMAA